MDIIIDRHKLIVSKYKELSEKDFISQTEVLDLRQEINRQNHLMDHNLRAHNNWAGRLVGLTVFGAIGFAFFLKQCQLHRKSSIKIHLKNFGIYVLGFSSFGYLYARRFHSNPADAIKNTDFVKEYREISDPEVKKIDFLLKEKLEKLNKN